MTIEDTLSPELLRIKKELERLNKMKIHVGIQGASGYDENGNDEEGAPADLVIFGEHEQWTVDHFESKAENSPFKGWTLPGKVHYTICAGKIVYRG